MLLKSIENPGIRSDSGVSEQVLIISAFDPTEKKELQDAWVAGLVKIADSSIVISNSAIDEIFFIKFLLLKFLFLLYRTLQENGSTF